jgi:PAS domain S-box-containing protein
MDTADDGDAAAAEVLAQQAAIAQIGQLALGERSLDALLDDACALVASILGTEFVSVAQLAADGTQARIVAGVGWPPGIVGELVLGAGDQSQAGFTLAAGEPVVVGDYATETRFQVVESLVEAGVRSGMSVRIGDEQAPYGTLSVFTARSLRFTRDDANFLRAVANILAAAVERLKIETALRASRDQLAAIVSSIHEGITVRDKHGLIFANGEAARLTGLDEAADLLGETRMLLERFELFDEAGQPMSIDQLPGRQTFVTGEPTEAVIGFRSAADTNVRWSKLRAVALRDSAGDVSHVVSIFRDVTDERWQRDASEYLVDAVAVLSSSLDTDEAAQRLAQLSVPRFADYCTVTLVQPDGSLKLVALAHVNPERVEMVRELERSMPPADPNGPSGAARVIREGIIDTGEITPEIVDSAPITEEQRRLIHALELGGYVTVPLIGRNRPIGALSLAMAESGRKLQPREVELARELGARAGIALENALLYQTADARRGELDAVLAAMADAVLVFDGGGALRMGNQAAQRTFKDGLPPFLHELWQRVSVTAEGAGTDRASREQAKSGEPLEVQVDGRSRWYELRRYTASSQDSGAAAPVVIVLRDVTEVRAARAARDAFMGVLSHELRTPITTIYGGSELLSRDMAPDQRAEVIADIRAESERLARLVEDLLVMTRVERGIVDIADEPILLQHLLASVISATGARWPGARLTLHAAVPRAAGRGVATEVADGVRKHIANAVR